MLASCIVDDRIYPERQPLAAVPPLIHRSTIFPVEGKRFHACNTQPTNLRFDYQYQRPDLEDDGSLISARLVIVPSGKMPRFVITPLVFPERETIGEGFDQVRSADFTWLVNQDEGEHQLTLWLTRKGNWDGDVTPVDPDLADSITWEVTVRGGLNCSE